MLDSTSKGLLVEILINESGPSGLNPQQFRAKHHAHLDLIDSLLSERHIIQDHGSSYHVPLLTLYELQDETPLVGTIFNLCDRIFQALRAVYLENAGQSVLISKLVRITNLTIAEISSVVAYLSESNLIHGYSTVLTMDESFVTPAEKLLRFATFGEVADTLRSQISRSAPVDNSPPPTFWPNAMAPTDELALESLLHPVIREHALQKYRDGHLRNAVMDSITAVFDLIRQKTGLADDGDRLAGKVFSLQDPYLVLSELESESGRSDQKGFLQLVSGAYQGIRNPKAHSLEHNLTAITAAQYLVFASLLARRVEEAKLTSAGH